MNDMHGGPNTPGIWQAALPRPSQSDHKYDRGHAAVYGAPLLTGATRLAAEACSRIGAGLVTVLANERGDIYRISLPPDIMVADGTLASLPGVRAVLAGCGGMTAEQEDDLSAYQPSTSFILDAAAITAVDTICADDRPTIITPHDGEFAKAFPGAGGSRLEGATSVATKTGAVVVLKGRETVIADPRGNVVTNTHASPYLAKAGAGDVLAGMIAGLVTQGMPTFMAACAAVWIHGDIAIMRGPGLVAGDLVRDIPAALTRLLR